MTLRVACTAESLLGMKGGIENGNLDGGLMDEGEGIFLQMTSGREKTRVKG